MKKHTVFQKIISVLLTAVLVLGMVPVSGLSAEAASVQRILGGRVADKNTMNEWQNYFGPDVMSTEFAGGVWTDKSVFTDASNFRAEITMDDPQNNFLIALSAIAANEQITGFTSNPVDVMLVLDVSGSMDADSKDAAMVQATNRAIHSLLAQNNHNRVGVVLYSGNATTNQNAGTNTATVILPLDRYTTSATQTVWENGKRVTIPAYFTLSGGTVSVASGVRNSQNRRISGEKSVSGGTYIQNGLYKAWGEFSKVTDTKVPYGGIQGGAQRTPVMVLMSDGQPTLATTAYNNVGSSQSSYGNGSEDTTTWQTVFLTQLTAAFVKGKMQSHYGTTPKFYTLGLGTGNSGYATAVLNPSSTSNTLDNYWNRFFDNTPDRNGNVNCGGTFSQWNIYKDSNVTSRYYSDYYGLASNTEAFLAEFQRIVEDINISSAGHVTLVGGAGEDLSGYITFVDELGCFMEVKAVKGLVLGANLYTGHNLAALLNAMGTLNDPTGYATEFVNSVRERLGLSLSDAQALLYAAYADGQLFFDNKGTASAADDAFSNYIGWYADQDGKYLGFWDKDTGITAAGAPEGAAWINRSYIYVGEANSSDMMHVVVRVCTNIQTGMQVVEYKIPASLIPKVTYEVALEGQDPASMTSITRKAADPLRLVYEVGLRSDVNSVNIHEIANDLPEGVHLHKQDDGTYEFFTNLWGSGVEGEAVDYNDPLGHEVAQSHFHPAEGNGRYYYTMDVPVYVRQGAGYVRYTGTAAPSGSNYYHQYHYYTREGYQTVYLPVSAAALRLAAENGRQADGGWYIPQGTVFQQIDVFKMQKDGNPTETLEYYNYPVVVRQQALYDVYAFLGNNGRLELEPAQGIRLSKQVTEPVEGAPTTFNFTVTLSQAVAEPVITDAEGNVLTEGWQVSGNQIRVELAAGETVCITGLPTGVTYTVEEEATRYYQASSQNATGTVQAYTLQDVSFTNSPKGYGQLIVSKDVEHPFATVPDAMYEKEFTIHVQLSGADVANREFPLLNSQNTVTTDANGVFTVKLKDNGSVTVADLPEGTAFTVTETLDPENHKGFRLDTQHSVLAGTVVKNETVQAHVVNVYSPAASRISLDVVGSKRLVDEAGAFDWDGKSFTVVLQQYDAATGTYTDVAQTQVDAANLRYAFRNIHTFDTLGTYYFKVFEQIPAERLEGMSYDASAGRMEVVVTDHDVDGQLEIAVYDFDTRALLAENNGTVTYTKDFTNIHSTDATFVEFTVNKNVVDAYNTGLTEAGYLFELYEIVDGAVATVPAYSMRTVMVDGQGQAVFHIPATKVGVRSFLLKESVPVGEAPVPGMLYDRSVYTVTVTTTAEDGKLVSTVAFTKDDQSVEAPEFNNVLDLEPLVLVHRVDKKLEGRAPMQNDRFEFLLEQTTGSFVPGSMPNGFRQTVTVDYAALTQNGGVAYTDPITITQVGTYYFRWSEIPGSNPGMTYDNSIYHVVVTVTFENGQLVKKVDLVRVGENAHTEQTDVVHFTNSYRNTDSGQIVLGGKKVLTGRQLLAGEFSFTLTGEGVSQTVTNLADGTFSFAPLTYTAADVGKHTYTVTEVADGKGGITYDGTSYTVTVTVADDGQGNLVVTTEGAQDIVFNNSYSYGEPIGITLGGSKSWLNTDSGVAQPMEGGEFTFVLYAVDETYTTRGAEVTRTTNAADGSFSLGVSFSRPGTYYYLLSEQIPEAADRIPGASYDTGSYQICVQVYDTGLGELKSTITRLQKEGTGETAIQFSNTYTPAPAQVVLEGTKTLTGRTLLDGEFDFVLADADSNVLQTVSNLGGKFTFAPLTFDKTGTYIYFLWEQIPAEAENTIYEGVAYDDTVFTVVITVTDDGSGQLQTAYTVTDAGAHTALAFTNVYTVTGYTEFSVAGGKTLTGKELRAGDYTFEMFDANGHRVAVAVNDANGGFVFEGVPVTAEGTSVFTMKERNDGKGGITYDEKVYTVTVTAADNGRGGLEVEQVAVSLNGTPVNSILFANSYAVEPISVQLRGQKILTGDRTAVGAGEFRFCLFNSMGALVQTQATLAGGGVVFDELTYTKPGEYRYYFAEEIPIDAVDNFKDGITYDDHVCDVTVIVTDNGDGTLHAEVVYENLPRFTNTYEVTEPASTTISGTKELVGKTLEADMFTFELLEDGQVVATATNDADGNFTFANVPLTELGYHTFTAVERRGQIGGIVYDSRSYTVSVYVADNGKGGMVAGSPEITYNGVEHGLVFTNRYAVTEPTATTITGSKQLLGVKALAAHMFSFQLYKGETLVATVTNAADGSFAFENVVLDSLGEHVFTVKEVIPADAVDNVKDGITYDPLVYTVKVNVTDNGEGGMTASAPAYFLGEPPVEAMVFTNRYDVQGTSATITGTKILTGKTLEDNMFAFELLKDGQRIALAQNVGSTFTFENIPLETLGDHVFTVRELVPEEAVNGVYNGITYSGAEYVVDVKLTTTDNGVGGMTVSSPAFTKGGQAVEDLVFENSYAVTGPATVTLEASKTLVGKELTADMFTFELYEGEMLLATAANAADGTIRFADVQLDALGVHTLTVKEHVGDLEGVTYSALVYTVTVNVADNGDGTKVATITGITLGEEAVEAITFENVFRPGDITVELNIHKTVENKTAAELSPEGFVFLLLQNGQEISRTTTNAHGVASFPLLFTADNLSTGTFAFQVKELDTDVAGVTYSEKVYEVTVNLTQDADGQLLAEVLINGEAGEKNELTFVNTYAPPATPETGDLSDLGTHMALLTGSALGMTILLAVLLLDKRKKATK